MEQGDGRLQHVVEGRELPPAAGGALALQKTFGMSTKSWNPKPTALINPIRCTRPAPIHSDERDVPAAGTMARRDPDAGPTQVQLGAQ